jgi:3-(3-hydroxy-phenyl)propionate hydroxylase
MGASLPKVFPYCRPPELDGKGKSHRKVIIVGAGPVGLAMALDWAQRGRDVLVLAASGALSEGSRAICFAKRTLEICDRVGCGEPVVGKGVSWNVGKVFRHDRLLYEFNLLPEPGHERPAFVNLQQYYFEQCQLEALARYASTTAAAGQRRSPSSLSSPTLLPDGERSHAARSPGTRGQTGTVDLRWNNRVTGVTPTDRKVTLSVQCPDGEYALSCDWLIACDGAGSPARKMLGLKSEGQVFQDRFLIADVKMQGASVARFRTERWFWFDPPFHRNQSALLHKQADDVWRIDFQLGWQADPELERQPERVLPRIRAMLGTDVEFSLEWVSVYTFQCRRMERFVHGRVIFAGDSAHQVSPFGARGANSGIQDVDNLGWKLDLVLRGLAPAALLDSYDSERVQAADENILNSTRSTDFITPKSEMSRIFRDATLELAAKYPFARRLVNSGRLSVPAHHIASPLNTPDAEAWPGAAASMVAPGSPALDAPVRVDGKPGWLLRQLGETFTAVVFAPNGDVPGTLLDTLERAATLPIPLRTIVVTQRPVVARGDVTWLVDAEGFAFSRYAPAGDAVYLFRPDQHVAGRRASFAADWLGAALRRAAMTDVPFTVGAC